MQQTTEHTQPEALRLADELAMGKASFTDHLTPAAAELRRLHEVNKELLKACNATAVYIDVLRGNSALLREAIAKATNQ